jgi:hypothetical protein
MFGRCGHGRRAIGWGKPNVSTEDTSINVV